MFARSPLRKVARAVSHTLKERGIIDRGGRGWHDSGIITESRVPYVEDYIPISYGLSGSTSAAATFTSTTASGNVIAATSITNTPLIGDFIVGTNVKRGTFITNIIGGNVTLSQNILGTLSGTYTCRRGVVFEFDATAHPNGCYVGSYASGNNKWVRPDSSDDATAGGANRVVISNVYPPTVATYTLSTSAHGIAIDTTTAQLASSGSVVGNTSGVIARIVGVPSTTSLMVEAPSGAFTAAEVLTTRDCTGAIIGNGTSTYSSISASLGYRNGVEYDPSDKASTKLDFAVAASPTSATYAAQTDFLPGKTITVASGDIHSIVKALSFDFSKNRPAIGYSSVLTVVYSGVTDSANKLRPHYFGAANAKEHITVGNLPYLSYTRLSGSADATVGVSGLSTMPISAVCDWFQGCWTDYFEGQGGESIRPMFSMSPQLAVSGVPGWTSYTAKTGVADASGYGCQTSSSQTYGSVVQELIHNAALRFLMSDFDITNSAHKQALINFLQASNDYRGLVANGVNFSVDGGHLGGRKAILLNGEYYLDAHNSAKFRAAITAQETTRSTAFSEDALTYYGHDGVTALYGSTGTDSQYWGQYNDTPAKKHYRDPYGLIDGGIDMFSGYGGSDVAYQGNTASGFINTVNWLRILGRTSYWLNGDSAKQAFFDYIDRYRTSGAKYDGDTAFALQVKITGTGTKTGTGYQVGDVIYQGTSGTTKRLGTVVEVVSADVYRVETKNSVYYTTLFLGGTDSGTGTANGTGCATNNGTGTGHDTNYTTGTYDKATYLTGASKYYGATVDNYGIGGGRWPTGVSYTTINYQSTYASNVDSWYASYLATTPTISAQAFSYNENQSIGATVATVVASPNRYSSGYSFKFTATGTTTSSDGYYSISTSIVNGVPTGTITLTAAGAAAGAGSNDFETAGSPYVHNVTLDDSTNATSASANMTLTVLDVLEGTSQVFDSTGNAARSSGTSNVVITHTPVATPSAVGVAVTTTTSSEPSAITINDGSGAKNMVKKGSLVNTPAGHTTAIWGLGRTEGATNWTGTGALTITITNGSSTEMAAASVAVTGSDPSSCFNAAAIATGSSASTGTTINPTSVLGEIIFAVVKASKAITLDAGFGTPDKLYDNVNYHMAVGHKTATSPSTSVAESHSSGNSNVIACAFKKLP